jgi:hypothetical protein
MYLPKSKYKLSQTSGREFMYAQSQKEYTGPYIILKHQEIITILLKDI